jgi:hypothetical protein
MRGFVAALAGVLVGGTIAATAMPAGAKETKEFDSGQLAGFVFTDENTGQFIDCTAWANNSNDVQIGISVNKNWNLDLWLTSDSWDLPTDKTYPISYWVDRNPLYHAKADTESQKYVKIAIERGQAVFEELKAGSQLTLRTQSDDYIFNLAGSSAALNQLLDCVDRYSKTASSNPFDGGSSNQQDNSGQGSQQGSGADQPQTGEGGEPASAKTMSLMSLTQSAEEVRQFLVDVTGAKPSMITVEPKTYKSSGAPYYSFSTPIGQGEFSQEYLGEDTLQDVALEYLKTYEDACDGQVEKAPKDPVQGERGQLAVGTAVCSDSPWQEGPEVLSYAMTTSGDVISIYVSYVGGNAAKAKTDSLGKLIARRSEDIIR